MGRIHSSSSSEEQVPYVKCGFCSDYYQKRSTSHNCFLRASDSLFKNNRHPTVIKSDNVFYYDIESRLECYYECKVERPERYDESTGQLVLSQKTIYKTCSFSTLDEVNDFEQSLTKQEQNWFIQTLCQSHQPMLVSVVNKSGSVKKDFCE